MKNLIKTYINNEKGLVTIEWVGVAAVVVLAAVLITSTVMKSTAGTANNVDLNQKALGASVAASTATIPANLGTSLTPAPAG
jgi:hypothetical protein